MGFQISDVWPFINSTFFAALVTFIVGLVALYIYKRKQWDDKKNAANIILLEIQYAERILSQVGSAVRGGALPNKFLMPTENWSQYKYYFVRDFDRDEWDLVTEFYNNAKLYDEAVSYNISLFQKNEEQIRVNMLRTPAKYIREYIETVPSSSEDEENERLENVFNRANKFQELYLSRIGSLFYSPNKPMTDGTNAFNDINKMLSQTSIGTKLKRLSGLKN